MSDFNMEFKEARAVLFWKHYLSPLLYILGCFSVASVEASECKLSDVDLTPLSLVPWIVKNIVDNTTVHQYNINLCNALTGGQCPAHSSICKLTNGSHAISIGNHTDKLNFTEDALKREFWVHLHGEPCSHTPGSNMRTVINFKCGKTLGSPELLDSYGCETYFEWHTSAVCSNPTAVQEIPCYVYDGNKKRDLNMLIKEKGGYLVTSGTGGSDFYINVCRDIKPDSSTKNCQNSSACAIVDGTAIKMGRPADGLKLTADGNLMLTYTSTTKPDQCTSNPSTTITFVCPKRGGGRDPVLTSDFNCHYEVEWQTEHACATDYLSTKEGCGFTLAKHDVDFDLTQLKKEKASDHPYMLEVGEYQYYINVCGELGIPCPNDTVKDGIAACQITKGVQNKGFSIGRLDHKELRYSDGELTLTYKGGAPCSSGFQRTTVIAFHCNKSISPGHSYPRFNSESSHCTYLFDWDTPLACSDHPLTSECRVDVGKKRFDLSALVKEKGDNWEALDGHHEHGAAKEARYFINVCHDVLNTTTTKKCPKEAAACMITENGAAYSIGKYLQSPVYNQQFKTILLNYTGGSPCSNGKTRSTLITMSCRPGDLEGGPTLVRDSADECIYEFEWATAAACALGQKKGENCKVFDDDAGFSFDLSRLTKTGDHAFYNISKKDHTYYINVCGEVSGTKCNDNNKHAAVCQVEKGGEHKDFNTGKPNGNLAYFDGMINLTYTDGDAYNTKPPIPRKTEIAFLCDPKAGAGKPEFQYESNHTYSFKWYTQYACPEAPVECVVTDPTTHEQYDLSSLSMSEDQENWSIIDDTDPKKKRKFYLNVCRPVNPVHVGTGCGAFAAACETQLGPNQEESVVHPSLGQALSRPTLVASGGKKQIVLEYSHGDKCVLSNHTETTYMTKIHLECKKGQLSSGPRFLEQIDNCVITFLWQTEAACPIEDATTDQEPCTVKDINSEYVFNLQPLKKKDGFYTVKSAKHDRTFQMNICGAVGSSVCASAGACEVQGDTLKQELGRTNDKLEFSDDGQLTLTYEGKRLDNGQTFHVLITFLCRKNISLGEPTFVRQEENAFIFDFATSLACRPEPVDCLVSDFHGNQYDLTPLARVEGNWQVVDSRSSHSDLRYYINVCRPINPIGNSSCPGGPVGGCQVSSGGAFNMGYVQGKPQAAPDGSVSIRYMNGSPCHKGTAHQGHRSTRINFYCADTEHDPSFKTETEDCEYIFDWMTPAACPLKRVVGHDCKVIDPLYSYEFDLSSLKKSTGSYSVQGDSYTFLLNVCDNVKNGTGACTKEKNVGACQTKTGMTPFDAGKANGNLSYEDGEITLTYAGGKGCHNNQFNRTTTITFLCDQSKNGQITSPKYIEEKSDCSYMFEWPTALACAPFKIGDCSLKDDQGNQYDLTSLSLTDGNYERTTSTAPVKKYVLNICRSLVHKKGVHCPYNAAACMIDTTQTDPKKRYHNIGEISDTPLKKKGNQLQLVYENGEICASGKKARTIIDFDCNRDAIDTEPFPTYVEDKCDYYFLWITQAACPVNGQPHDDTSLNNCTAKNPVTGYTFNLNSLKTEVGYSIKDTKGHSYKFNVCGPVKNSLCKGGSVGSCQEEQNGAKRAFAAGHANARLMYNDGVLTLNYSGGDFCHHNNQTRSTIIDFVCPAHSHEAAVGQPYFVDESDDCTYYIAWHTEYACETRVRCSVQTANGTVDLSPLIRSSGSHLALTTPLSETKDPGATFYINLCGPLNPEPGVLCPSGASACRVKAGEKPKDIGRAHTPPVIDQTNGKITLLYDHGDKCAADQSKNMSSKIEFVCKPGTSQGQPSLQDFTDCQYIFTWETNVVCIEGGPISGQDCKFHDTKTKYTFDLSPLRKSEQSAKGYYEVGQYKINICSPVHGLTGPCSNAGICGIGSKGDFAFGDASHSQLVMDDRILKLKYTDGTDCSRSESGKATSQIIFECDRNAGLGEPEFSQQSTCDIVFRWKTSLACPPPTEDCSLAFGGKIYDLRVLSREVGSWQFSDSSGNKYWMNICQGVHRTQIANCPQGAAVCRETTTGVVDNLGLVNTQHLYMDNDGKTIVLQYTEGSNACSHGKRRSDNTAAKTTIRFMCANTVGGPQFVPKSSDDDSCSFEFEWKSSIACQNEREEVKESSGLIKDPKSSYVIDLNKLSRNFAATETRGQDHYEYLIRIDQAVDLTGHNDASVCQGSAVCQTKPGTSFHRDLGAFSSRKFYMEDDYLEAVFESTSTCGKDSNKKVQTVIQFGCSETDQSPIFLDETHDCTYLFHWDVSVVCIKPDVVNPTPIPNSGGGSGGTHGTSDGGTNGKTIGAIIGIFVGVVALCLIVIYFHRADRRIAFKVKVQNCFGGGKEDRYQYSVLSQLQDEDDNLMEVTTNSIADDYGTNLHETDNLETSKKSKQKKHKKNEEKNSLLQTNTRRTPPKKEKTKTTNPFDEDMLEEEIDNTNPKGYHDISDDDMLI